ncbi:MAG: hypothetical protein HYS13_12355 [Planctomycetia bacterium]|nr:hypothetical protein [Planctomycetia bacterium]
MHPVWRFVPLAVIPLSLALAGCGGGTSPSESAATTPAKPPDIEKAKQTVHDFLAAVKKGDDAGGAKFLSPKALEETGKHGMVFAPSGSDTATFTVVEAEEVAGGMAHVLTQWTDVEEGAKQTAEYLWVLRAEGSEWRVVGMIARPFPDLPALVLDFENAADMDKKLAEYEQEDRRRRGQATATTSGGADPFSAPANPSQSNPPRTATRTDGAGEVPRK